MHVCAVALFGVFERFRLRGKKRSADHGAIVVGVPQSSCQEEVVDDGASEEARRNSSTQDCEKTVELNFNRRVEN